MLDYVWCLLYGGVIINASVVVNNNIGSYFSKDQVLSTGWSKEDPYGEHHLYWSNPPEKVCIYISRDE